MHGRDILKMAEATTWIEKAQEQFNLLEKARMAARARAAKKAQKILTIVRGLEEKSAGYYKHLNEAKNLRVELRAAESVEDIKTVEKLKPQVEEVEKALGKEYEIVSEKLPKAREAYSKASRELRELVPTKGAPLKTSAPEPVKPSIVPEAKPAAGYVRGGILKEWVPGKPGKPTEAQKFVSELLGKSPATTAKVSRSASAITKASKGLKIAGVFAIIMMTASALSACVSEIAVSHAKGESGGTYVCAKGAVVDLTWGTGKGIVSMALLLANFYFRQNKVFKNCLLPASEGCRNSMLNLLNLYKDLLKGSWESLRGLAGLRDAFARLSNPCLVEDPASIYKMENGKCVKSTAPKAAPAYVLPKGFNPIYFRITKVGQKEAIANGGYKLT